ncbi:hypothetical protein LMG19083_03002 [Ralstonia psammae]|uniref:Uncharacterized protein n=1 Tax=Ralstonia psammae TaxID=3058598 RepID=A0ABM9JM59_9RALS|nr:DUF6375 family protein [Ralstonia sp. LMG 19083]CAJ0797375.1 hypothetical protein LMG19083_03002 [Ralstonia sp. LMG 19083]
MNLVLIGRFKHARDAEQVEDLIGKLTEQAIKDETYSVSHADPDEQRFSDDMRKMLWDLKVYTLGPVEIEQFAFDHNLERKEATITVRTDEADVSAFIKLFVEAGARVEVFSAHHQSPEE